MKRTPLIILTALLGVSLLVYPLAAGYISKKNGSYAAEAYKDRVTKTDKKELQAAWDAAVKYNENLSGNPVHDPFLVGSGMAMGDDYRKVLDIGGTMGYITIPKIRVKLPIYHGTSDSTLHKGVGHLEGSSMPVGGEGSHCVLTGHTGLSDAKMFTDLTKLKTGDTFYLHVLDKTLAYRVNEIRVVEPDKTGYLKRVPGKDYCTLVTCTPYGVNSHRLLVRGVRTAYRPQKEKQAAKTPDKGMSEGTRTLLLVAVGATAAMSALVILTIILTKKNTKQIPAEGDAGQTPTKKDAGQTPTKRDAGQVSTERDAGQIPLITKAKHVPAKKNIRDILTKRNTQRLILTVTTPDRNTQHLVLTIAIPKGYMRLRQYVQEDLE